MTISGAMPRLQRYMHTFGFSFVGTGFAGMGLTSLKMLFHSVGASGSRAEFLSALAMTLFPCIAVGSIVWLWRRIAKDFLYDGATLRYSTLGNSVPQTRHILEIAKVSVWRGRGGAQGYRLRFRDGQKLYLQFTIPNAREAVEQMRRDCPQQL